MTVTTAVATGVITTPLRARNAQSGLDRFSTQPFSTHPSAAYRLGGSWRGVDVCGSTFGSLAAAKQVTPAIAADRPLPRIAPMTANPTKRHMVNKNGTTGSRPRDFRSD